MRERPIMLGGVLEHGKVRKHRSVGRIVTAVTARNRPAEHGIKPAADNLALTRDILESGEHTNDVVGRDVGNGTGADKGENVPLEGAHPALGRVLVPGPSGRANRNDGLGRLGKGDGRTIRSDSPGIRIRRRAGAMAPPAHLTCLETRRLARVVQAHRAVGAEVKSAPATRVHDAALPILVPVGPDAETKPVRARTIVILARTCHAGEKLHCQRPPVR